MRKIACLLALFLLIGCGSKDENKVGGASGPAPAPAQDGRCYGNTVVNPSQNYNGICINGAFTTINQNGQSGYTTTSNQWHTSGPYYQTNNTNWGSNSFEMGTYDDYRYQQDGGAYYQDGNDWTWRDTAATAGIAGSVGALIYFEN